MSSIKPALFVSERRRWPRDEAPADKGSTKRPPILRPLAFSTRELAPEDQFAAWREHMAVLYDVKMPEDTSATTGFVADHTVWNIGGMLVVQQRSPAYRFSLTADRLRSSPIDHWYIVLLKKGSMWTEVAGRVAESHSEEILFGSLGNPFSGRLTANEALVLYLPREMFADRSASLDALTNTVLSGSGAAALADYLRSLESRLSMLVKDDLATVLNTTCEMIFHHLEPLRGNDTPRQQTNDRTLMERARLYVQKNLSNAGLSPAKMAIALGVSRTRIYTLFEQSGGVFHYIQRCRLQAAHVALSNPTDKQRIMGVAEAVGFKSAAHFSRAFSKEFGYSPRDAINKSLASRRAHARIDHRDDGAVVKNWLGNSGG
jgi:AraC-like DNA-binding protein